MPLRNIEKAYSQQSSSSIHIFADSPILLPRTFRFAIINSIISHLIVKLFFMLKYGFLSLVLVASLLVAGCGKQTGDTTGTTGTDTTTTGGTGTTTGGTGTTNTSTTGGTTGAADPSGTAEADKAQLDSMKSGIDESNGAIEDSSGVDDAVIESQSSLR